MFADKNASGYVCVETPGGSKMCRFEIFDPQTGERIGAAMITSDDIYGSVGYYPPGHDLRKVCGSESLEG